MSMKRLELKVSILVGKAKGDVDIMRVQEAADALGMSITDRQAKNLIKKAKKMYGY